MELEPLYTMAHFEFIHILVGFATVYKACAYRNVVGICPALTSFKHKTFTDSIEVVY